MTLVALNWYSRRTPDADSGLQFCDSPKETNAEDPCLASGAQRYRKILIEPVKRAESGGRKQKAEIRCQKSDI